MLLDSQRSMFFLKWKLYSQMDISIDLSLCLRSLKHIHLCLHSLGRCVTYG